MFLLLYPEFNRSQDSTVGIETGCGLDSQWVGVPVEAGFSTSPGHPDQF
jgi:hypothetical protein